MDVDACFVPWLELLKANITIRFLLIQLFFSKGLSDTEMLACNEYCLLNK